MSISIAGLSFSYDQTDVKALSDINLQIDDGEFIALIGRSGSGKSTLLQHINGLLKPQSGVLRINGTATDTNEFKSERKKIGTVFQNPERQLFEETVYKDIGYGLKNRRYTKNQIEKSIISICHEMDIDLELLSENPIFLSGGQKRKIAIAGVLVTNPEILLLDEPGAGLDPESREHIIKLIKKYQESRNATIIMVSHDMDEVAVSAERVVVMNKGKVVLADNTRKVFSQSELLRNYNLCVPEITAFMDELRLQTNLEFDTILSVDEAVDILINATGSPE